MAADLVIIILFLVIVTKVLTHTQLIVWSVSDACFVKGARSRENESPLQFSRLLFFLLTFSGIVHVREPTLGPIEILPQDVDVTRIIDLCYPVYQ